MRPQDNHGCDQCTSAFELRSSAVGRRDVSLTESEIRRDGVSRKKSWRGSSASPPPVEVPRWLLVSFYSGFTHNPHHLILDSVVCSSDTVHGMFAYFRRKNLGRRATTWLFVRKRRGSHESRKTWCTAGTAPHIRAQSSSSYGVHQTVLDILIPYSILKPYCQWSHTHYLRAKFGHRERVFSRTSTGPRARGPRAGT